MHSFLKGLLTKHLSETFMQLLFETILRPESEESIFFSILKKTFRDVFEAMFRLFMAFLTFWAAISTSFAWMMADRIMHYYLLFPNGLHSIEDSHNVE